MENEGGFRQGFFIKREPTEINRSGNQQLLKRWKTSLAGVDVAGDVPDRRRHLLVGLDLALDLADGGEHGGVVAVDELADAGKGQVRQIPDQICRAP